MINKDFNYYVENMKQFYSNDPFPHWIVDDMFDEKKLSEISSSKELLKKKLTQHNLMDGVFHYLKMSLKAR